MRKEDIDECCCENKKEALCYVKKINLCPNCKNKGIIVKNITVKHIILDELIDLVCDDNYFLCMNEECDITYYNTESNMKFNKQQVKVPIWFKKDANPKYACYCSKVTEEQIINNLLSRYHFNTLSIILIATLFSTKIKIK